MVWPTLILIKGTWEIITNQMRQLLRKAYLFMAKDFYVGFDLARLNRRILPVAAGEIHCMLFIAIDVMI